MASIDALSHKPERVWTGSPHAVRVWLLVVAALVFAMVLVGGATRLTKSGLSITQWKPVTGVLPPLSFGDWQAEFDHYRQIPQYAELNPDMTLDGFKTIFWWEWSHRLLARIVGLIYILPALWFWARGAFKGALGRQVALTTALLALEPIVGWWMVSSGLSDRTEVAQERLALHLLIASGVFGAAIYAAVGIGAQDSGVRPARLCDRRCGLRAPRLCPARSRRAGRRLAGGTDLQHVAADGAAFSASRGVRQLRGAAERRDDGAIRPSADRLPRPRLRLGSGGRRGSVAPAAVAGRAAGVAAIAALQVALGVTTLVFSVPIDARLGASGLSAHPFRPRGRALERDPGRGVAVAALALDGVGCKGADRDPVGRVERRPER